MPKMKTRRGAQLRFKKTGSGKVAAYHSGKIHFKRRKNANRKRKLRQKQIITGGDAKRVKRLLPYIF